MESDWSEPLSIKINAPKLRIDSIKSGFGCVRVVIKNSGNAKATDIKWSIDFQNGVLLNSYSNGTISSIDIGKTAFARSFFIFGMGLPIINVEIESSKTSRQKEATTGLVFGPVIIV
jgi:hypothetical protein